MFFGWQTTMVYTVVILMIYQDYVVGKIILMYCGLIFFFKNGVNTSFKSELFYLQPLLQFISL